MSDSDKFLDVLKKSSSVTNIAEPVCRMREVMLQEIDDVFKSRCKTTNKVKNDKLNSIQQHFLDFFGEKLYDFYRDLREEYSQMGFLENVDNNGFMDIFLENLSIYEKERYDQDEDVDGEDK